MRQIGHLQEQQGKIFGDFLVAKGIRNEIEAAPDGSSLVWIVEEDHVSEARTWLEKFKADPAGAEFRKAVALAGKMRKAEAEDLARYQRRVRSRKSLFVKFGGYGVGLLTFLLIGACAVTAFYSGFGENEDVDRKFFISDPLTADAGFLPDVLQHGEFWRLLTPLFLHFGVLHLLFNMMWLFQLGCMIEARQSSLRLLLLVVATGIFSNLMQYFFAGPQFGGMSGVVYALAGYVWMQGKFDRASGLFLNEQGIVILLIWLVVCFTGAVGPVANCAHLGGLLSGMAIGRVSAYLATRKPE